MQPIYMHSLAAAVCGAHVLATDLRVVIENAVEHNIRENARMDVEYDG